MQDASLRAALRQIHAAICLLHGSVQRLLDQEVSVAHQVLIHAAGVVKQPKGGFSHACPVPCCPETSWRFPSVALPVKPLSQHLLRRQDNVQSDRDARFSSAPGNDCSHYDDCARAWKRRERRWVLFWPTLARSWSGGRRTFSTPQTRCWAPAPPSPSSTPAASPSQVAARRVGLPVSRLGVCCACLQCRCVPGSSSAGVCPPVVHAGDRADTKAVRQ